MKRNLTILTLLLTASLASAATPSQAERDSLTRKEKMALELIESVNQLSRTASRLSETALELISHDNPARKRADTRDEHSVYRESRPEEPPYRQDVTTCPADPVLSADSLDARERELAERERVLSQKEANLDNEIGDYIIRKWGPKTENTEMSEASDTSEISEVANPVSEAGRMVWVPDSMTSAVRALLAGERSAYSASHEEPAVVTRKNLSAGPEDRKVIFRGDTLDMVLRDRNLGRFDRKLFNYLAVPRGIWKASLTASYGEISTQDMEMLDLISDINIGGYIFSIKPAISYFIRDNLAIGCRLAYTRGHGYVDGFNVDIDEDMNFSLDDIDYQSESYRAGVTLTRYLGLSPRSRFHLTNEVELAFASGNSDFQRPFDGTLKRTHTTTMSVGVTYSPGVSVQIMRNVCFDLSFGVFGFQLKSERQSVDGVDAGRRTTSGANFRFNIFNLSFGIGVTV